MREGKAFFAIRYHSADNPAKRAPVELLNIDSGLLGDINNDTIINILDIVTLVNFLLNTSEPEECQSEAGDMNQDGGLNILDIVQLVNIILNV